MDKIKIEKLELPDHSDQLERAVELLTKVGKEYKQYLDLAKLKMVTIYGKDHVFKDSEERDEILQSLIEIPKDKRRLLVYTTDTVLGAVGDLSQTRFDVRDSLEEEYVKKYKKTPELGRTLFLEHYEKIHKEYDKLKAKSFDLLSKLDPDASVVDTI